jgi:hypothetical protein
MRLGKGDFISLQMLGGLDYWGQAATNDFIFFGSGTPFPPNFKEVVKTLFKRLFRVYAHIYHSHFQKIVSLNEEAHLNTCFKHFILFTNVSLTLLTAVNSVENTITHQQSWPMKRRAAEKFTALDL